MSEEDDDDVGKSKQVQACDAVRRMLNARGCLLVVIDERGVPELAVSVQASLKPFVSRVLRAMAQGWDIARSGGDVSGGFALGFDCPACGATCVAAPLGLSGDKPKGPSAGDATVCGGCASFLIFDDDKKLRAITEAELAALPDKVREMMTQVRKIVRGQEY